MLIGRDIARALDPVMLARDVGLPDLDPWQQKLLRSMRPGLKVLFATGYTRNAIVHNGVLDRDVNVIVKPYSIEQLARKLRDMLA